MTLAKRTVAVIEGDDAAPEAVRPTIDLVKSLDLGIEFSYPIVGEEAIETSGSPLPQAAIDMIDAADTTFFGSSSGKSGIALMYLRWGKGTFANVRPHEVLARRAQRTRESRWRRFHHRTREP